MTKTLLLLIVCSVFLLNGCTKKDEKTEAPTNKTETSTTPPTTTSKTETANTSTEEKKESEKKETEKKDSDKKELRDKSGAIRVNFPAGATEVTLNGKITGFGEHITYVFEVKKGQQLNASVGSSDKNANIRIAQIITPKGDADGPFGPSAKYDLNESGDWKLVLSENQMAGDPWKGEYKLTIKIK